MLTEVDNFFLAHFNIVASVVLLIVGYIKLVQSSKSNGDKLDSVITENKNIATSQQKLQLDVSNQGIQMSGVAKDITEIKHDMRSHDKEISGLSARMSAAENQLRAN